MRIFFAISAFAALITLAFTSCSGNGATQRQDIELVYEGSMAEPQIGEQAAARATADTLEGNMSAAEIKSN